MSRQLDPYPRIPPDEPYQTRKLTDLFRDVAVSVNSIDAGKSDLAFEAGAGPVLKDADGHYWRLEVTTLGVITTVDLGTTRP